MNSAALVCIDFQNGFDDPIWGRRNNPDAENKIGLLLTEWRKTNFPVIHIRHCSLEEKSPLRAGTQGNEFKPEAMPADGEKIFSKSVNSAFIGTDLEKYLRDNHVESLVIAGLTTDHCVSTSTRMAGNLGFNVTLVSDATATFDRKGIDGTLYTAEQIHKIHLASLQGEFCTVLNHEDVLLQISGSAGGAL